ncbi:hypothetical protein NKG94_22845 [Micromonospora sp. M12]
MTQRTTAVWYYAKPTSFVGSLQHGLGRGAYRALRDPATRQAVLACVKRDYRWDWLVDERAVYLARLIRDLALPIPPLLNLLNQHAVDEDDRTFDNTLEVLETLGRAGDRPVIDGLRWYVHNGPRWVDVLQTIARDWSRELWDDLLPVAQARLAQGDHADGVLWRSSPWQDWADADDHFAAGVAAFQPRSASRPLEQLSIDDLLTMLRTGGIDRQRTCCVS